MTRPLAAAPAAARERFVLRQTLQAPRDTFAEDVRRGLTANPKELLPQYFYDALGSALFEAICQLPEYYVTRAEQEILEIAGREIARAFGSNVQLVELGSGSGRKTRLLIEAILAEQEELDYFPIDIDPVMLERSARQMLADYPSLAITGITGDFREPAAALSGVLDRNLRTVVLFLGSSIGNLDPEAAVAMLRNLREALSSGDALFLGADLRKPASVLIPAYADALGVTAAFNLNLLARINRELGGHFDLATFAHEARYDEVRGRVEMHLVSTRAQRVTIDAAGIEVPFDEGESIHTENSYKYDFATLEGLAAASGFEVERKWTDSRGWFADLLLVAR